MTTFEKVAEFLEPFASTFELNCSKHPANEAIMTCTACGEGMCHDCIAGTAEKTAVICQACSIQAKKKHALASGIKLLKLPAAWVILCVVISGIAYSCNFSNPSLAEMSAIESRRPWFQKHVGKLLLDKASRENQRSAALRYLKKPDEAVEWSKRAAVAFARTAEYWRETPVYNALKIGEARSVFYSDDSERALTMLKSLNIKSSSVIYPSYIYYMGEVYEKNGDSQQALKCFKQAMMHAEIIERQQLDHFTNLMSGDRRAAKVIISVRKICGVSLSVGELKEKLKKYGIKPKPKPLGVNLGRFSKLLNSYKGKIKLKKDSPRKTQEKPPEEEIEIEFIKPAGEQKKPPKDDFTVEILN